MCVLMPTQVLVLVLVLGHQVLVLVLGHQVLVLVLVLGHQVLVLVLVLESQVLDNNTALRPNNASDYRTNGLYRTPNP